MTNHSVLITEYLDDVVLKQTPIPANSYMMVVIGSTMTRYIICGLTSSHPSRDKLIIFSLHQGRLN